MKEKFSKTLHVDKSVLVSQSGDARVLMSHQRNDDTKHHHQQHRYIQLITADSVVVKNIRIHNNITNNYNNNISNNYNNNITNNYRGSRSRRIY